MSPALTRARAVAERLRAELAANPRLAPLLLLIPALLLAWLALLAGDLAAAAIEDRAPLERRAARLAALAASGDWEARIEQSRAELARRERQAWTARSAELAAADLQTVLRAITAEHLAWNRLKLSPAERIATIDGWRIKAEINGKLKDDGVLGIVQAIAEHQPRILIEQLNVANQRGQTINLHLAVVVLGGEQAP